MKVTLEKWLSFSEQIPDQYKRDWLEKHGYDLEEALIEKGISAESLDDLYSPEEHKDNIRQGRYPEDKIERLLSRGIIQSHEYEAVKHEMHWKKIKEGSYSISDINGLTGFSIDEKHEATKLCHLTNIRKGLYNAEQIAELIFNQDLSREDLEGQVNLQDVEEMLPLIRDVDFATWDDIPPLHNERTDIFVLGLPGSGKTMFMAGLFYYGAKTGKLTPEFFHASGVQYYNELREAISDTAVLRSTTREVVQYMACDFACKSKRGENIHPLTFLEMSGEIFEDFYYLKGTIPDKLKEYIEGRNQKIIVLVIDYEADMKVNSGEKTKQQSKLEFALQVLERHGALKTVDALCILITKWDMSPDSSDTAASKFLEEKGYKGLYALCKKFSKKYKFSVEIQKFSLGKFYGIKNKKYVYSQADSEKMFQWFCDHSGRPEDGGGGVGLLGKLFK